MIRTLTVYHIHVPFVLRTSGSDHFFEVFKILYYTVVEVLVELYKVATRYFTHIKREE